MANSKPPADPFAALTLKETAFVAKTSGGRPRVPVPENISTALTKSKGSGKGYAVTLATADDAKAFTNLLRRAGRDLNFTVRIQQAEAAKDGSIVVTFKATNKIVHSDKGGTNADTPANAATSAVA